MIYFAFSDECGKYKNNPSKKFLRANSLHLRATFVIKGDDWIALNSNFTKLKEKYGFPIEKEIKWSYLWKLKKIKNESKIILPDNPVYFLKDFQLSTILNFINESIGLIAKLTYIKIIITITQNTENNYIKEISLLKMHIQDTIQRIEMELQYDQNNLCIIFFDPVSDEMNKYFRNIYHDMYESGDFIKKYSHIKDSINLEYSHHSAGIQIADYIAGATNGFFREFKESTQIFNEIIRSFIRKDREDNPLGWGIIEIPKNEEFRKRLKEKWDEYYIDVPF